MKEIKLSQGKVALVDDEDFDRLNIFVWYAQKCKETYYAERKETILGKRTHISMHRMIMNAVAGEIIDHHDRDGLNNQKSNLRRCTLSQNGANKKPRGSSKYLGVSIYNRKYKNKTGEVIIKSKWLASLQANNKTMFLGYFDNEDEAAIAYNKAAIQYHGEFANLNVITEKFSVVLAEYDNEVNATIIQ